MATNESTKIFGTKKTPGGRWIVWNTRTGDCIDQTYMIELEAVAAAAEANANWESGLAELKAIDARARARQAKIAAASPTRILTSRGDGWEGNG